ncbi:MAG: diguanylate cyclase [Planctomycetes bacterium]|nr:diguanylate cyclase [Planctomycetota bacterium]
MAILIVDDSPINRRILESVLRQTGHTDIEHADSADQAWQRVGLHSNQPRQDVELILMDIMMPGTSGIEAARAIKARAELHDVPIIMATAVDEETSLQEAFEAGAMDYLTKPFRRIELQARVASALAIYREIRTRKQRERELLETTTKLEEANAALHRLSTLDGLTGVANRRWFNEMLESELRRAHREHMEGKPAVPVSLVLMDIDHFKQFNDTYGHLAGDDTLKAVAGALTRAVRRPADMVARYGGEEFVALLPRTDTVGAVRVAENMRAEVERLDIQHEKSTAAPYVTVSLGVATTTELDGAALIRAADECLYQAKHEGRNRVKFRPQPAPTPTPA